MSMLVYALRYSCSVSFVALIIVTMGMFNNYVLIHCTSLKVSRLTIIITRMISDIMNQKINQDGIMNWNTFTINTFSKDFYVFIEHFLLTFIQF